MLPLSLPKDILMAYSQAVNNFLREGMKASINRRKLYAATEYGGLGINNIKWYHFYFCLKQGRTSSSGLYYTGHIPPSTDMEDFPWYYRYQNNLYIQHLTMAQYCPQIGGGGNKTFLLGQLGTIWDCLHQGLVCWWPHHVLWTVKEETGWTAHCKGSLFYNVTRSTQTPKSEDLKRYWGPAV